MPVHRRSLLGLPFALALASAHAQPATLTIAAASDLRFALDELLQSFRATRPGVRVDVVYGSSGKLSTQVRNGAPFDIFFSADRAYAQELEVAGFTAGAPRLYATGRLVAWSADAVLGRLSLDDLVRHPSVKRFAIANPDHAPYGQRAVEVLRNRGLYDAVAPRLVLGDNINQAAQFVQTGAAQAGIVAYSLVLSPALAGQGAKRMVIGHTPRLAGVGILRNGTLVQIDTGISRYYHGALGWLEILGDKLIPHAASRSVQ